MRFASRPRADLRLPDRLTVEICERVVDISVRRNTRAKRLVLRIDPGTGLPVLTFPPRARVSEGERFLRKHAGWIETRLAREADSAPFNDGCTFPLRGGPCRIAHSGGRGLVRLDSGAAGQSVLVVPGEAAHLPRRVADWLKREARRDLEAAVATCASALGRQPGAIRIGDARSRWGSCSSSGALAFSWRLVLAPSPVLFYLAAHETAHLLEMNHGPAFWALVARLDPQHAKARAWLKAHGAGLHRIGRGAAPLPAPAQPR